jgi:hypothetical protein
MFEANLLCEERLDFVSIWPFVFGVLFKFGDLSMIFPGDG